MTDRKQTSDLKTSTTKGFRSQGPPDYLHTTRRDEYLPLVATAALYSRVMEFSGKLNAVPGWLDRVDQICLQEVLTYQSSVDMSGDLLELGVYQGKSAIHLAHYLSQGESITVCDLFDEASSEQTIRADARHAYRSLSQATFEKNWLTFFDKLPTIVRGLSSTIVNYVEPSSCRLVHIDASHMYEHVMQDAVNARSLLLPDGVVVFDDYRTEHTLGTAAAVWENVISLGLNPVCATRMKFYGTWGDPEPYQAIFEKILTTRSDLRLDDYTICGGRRIVRVIDAGKKSKPKAGIEDENGIKSELSTLKKRIDRLEAVWNSVS